MSYYSRLAGSTGQRLSSWRHSAVTKIQSRRIEYAQQLELQKQENKSALVEDSLENLPDSVRAQRLQQSFGVFGDAMVGTEDYTTLQNDVVELRISNKGGRICYARLKEYDTYNDEPLVLFDEKESNFNFTLVTQRTVS